MLLTFLSSGNNASKYRVLEGLSNAKGNSGTVAPNIIAHIQYFQTNMYYCALPLPLGFMGGAGTKRSVEGVYDQETTVEEFRTILRSSGRLDASSGMSMLHLKI